MGSTILQPTYKRQRFLLSFISQLKDSVSSTDLQKLVFLHTMGGHSNYYEFIPYKYGAYSFQLAEDLETLRHEGFLKDGVRIESLDKTSDVEIPYIAKERGNKLLRKAYRQYHYYTINSEMIDQLFNSDEAKSFYEYRDQYIQNEDNLFTIGYEGKTIENFVNILINNDVHVLVDVRKNPISHKFGFSKNRLKHIIETVGIMYIHIPDLGIASEDRNYLKTREDYKKLFDNYEQSLGNRQEYLDQVYSLFVKYHRICLVCFEQNPEMCHRHVIRDYLTKSYNIRSKDL